ncbi:hypothetical protein GCM10007888_00950 [Methylobacterium oxalidis]|uniref:Uncharacterized protein n=1 Tax=Methylobacterium oxalidis TaxID=944322 RepID=A0ABQ6DCP0_9HYPH|nr:hypothetical protein GCM10007888_00950 [Methylobacterium oxalidis]
MGSGGAFCQGAARKLRRDVRPRRIVRGRRDENRSAAASRLGLGPKQEKPGREAGLPKAGGGLGDRLIGPAGSQ